jgi:hypothetical protein
LRARFVPSLSPARYVLLLAMDETHPKDNVGDKAASSATKAVDATKNAAALDTIGSFWQGKHRGR